LDEDIDQIETNNIKNDNQSCRYENELDASRGDQVRDYEWGGT